MQTLPASPCIRNCCLDDQTQICMGCFRTLDEILAWHRADATEREQILARCEMRRAADRDIRLKSLPR